MTIRSKNDNPDPHMFLLGIIKHLNGFFNTFSGFRSWDPVFFIDYSALRLLRGKPTIARNGEAGNNFGFSIAFLCCMYYNANCIDMKDRSNSGRNSGEMMRYADVPTSTK